MAYYDFGKLLEDEDRYGGEDCLNGIAHNDSSGITYLTGKQYGKMYKVKLDLEGLSETLSKTLSDSVNSNRTASSRKTKKSEQALFNVNLL